MKQTFTFFMLLSAIVMANAATYRTYVYHSISGNTYTIRMDTDTAFGETALGELSYTGGSGFSGLIDGTYVGPSPGGSFWDVVITVPSGATNVQLQMATRNQSGTEYGFTGFFTMNNLPVELTSFSAETKRKYVSIHWQTASETQNSHFNIQRSADSKNWINIGKVEGQGTTLLAQEYSFIDRLPDLGKNYYRLEQVDFDGSVEYSKTVSIDFGEKAKATLSPNPVRSEIFIKIPSSDGGQYEAKIFGTDGQLLASQNFGSGEKVDVFNLPPGMYFIRIENEYGHEILTERFIKK